MASKQYGTCAFCTEYRLLTNEDIFARWMRQVIPRSGLEKQTRGTINIVRDNNRNLVPVQVTWKQSGHAASVRVACVCASCNNEWMSVLENQNKAVLTALIEGKDILLFPRLMRGLATWSAKTVMAAEFYRPDKVAIPQAQRTWLMNNKLPPSDGWSIWIAPYDGPQWTTQILHLSTHLPPQDPSRRIPGDDSLNTQSTLFVLGHVAFYVISTVSEGHPYFTLKNEQLSDFRRIWPVPSVLEAWPRGRWLNKGDLVRIVDSFNCAIGAPPLRLWD